MEVQRPLSLGEAARVFCRLHGVGRATTPPSPAQIAAAQAALGPDYWAYLRARVLTEKPITAYFIGDQRLGDAEAERGLAERLRVRCYDDIETWEEVAEKEREAVEQARFAGREPPDLIPVPGKVREEIERRMRVKAERGRGARGGQAGRAGGPPPAPKPDEGGGGPKP
uniref:Uncharacterized protein n=1 Tax=Bosea sp. NBC_00436 TaxID=2969620 RepID=A0A9E8CQV1_9HYPH